MFHGYPLVKLTKSLLVKMVDIVDPMKRGKSPEKIVLLIAVDVIVLYCMVLALIALFLL